MERTPTPTSKFTPIWQAYAWALVVALGAGWVTAITIDDASPLLIAGCADIAATLVIYGFSVRYRNASFYDAYWSVVPPILALYFLWLLFGNHTVRQLLILVLVAAWAWRLTANWARGWQGLQHEDWRYVQLREQTGRAYWLVNLLGIHAFPTALVFAGCLSIYVAFGGDRPLGVWDLCAALLGASALWLETVADNQLHSYRQQGRPTELLTTGVWAWCRHPNYLGELGFWYALWVFAWAAAPERALGIALSGPIVMTVLFVGISIPLIEGRLSASRSTFADHKARSFALLPFSHLVWRQQQ